MALSPAETRLCNPLTDENIIGIAINSTTTQNKSISVTGVTAVAPSSD